MHMKKFVVGMAAGIVLGLTVNALALSGYYNTRELIEQNRTFQLGYVAGVVDMLTDAADTLIEDPEGGADEIIRQRSCIPNVQLGPLTDRLMRKMRTSPTQRTYQAASFIAFEMCSP
jgi:hypothetical protein